MPRSLLSAPLAFSLCAGLWAPPTPAVAQCPATEVRYGIVELGTLGGPRSYALDLTDDGRVVGGTDLASGAQHPFLWEDGVMTDLGTLSGPAGVAGGINESGEIAGQADTSTSRRAFLWAGGTITELPTLDDGPNGRGFDVNDSGLVVGISDPGNGYQHPFLYDSDTGEITDLGLLPGDNAGYANAINVAGQVAGWSGPSNVVTGAVATLNEGGMITPLGTLGGSRSVAFGLDDAGRVVGWADLPGDATYHAFAWESGNMRDLGTLGGLFSLASTAHAGGPVVGWSTTPSGTPGVDGPQHAFVYANDAMADLNALVPADSGWEVLTNATAVNASGQIAGIGTIGGQIRAFLATPANVTVDGIVAEVESFALPHGTENSLLAKLAHVRQAVDGCTPSGACGALGSFVNEVEAQAGKKLTPGQAQALLDAAQALLATLGCP